MVKKSMTEEIMIKKLLMRILLFIENAKIGTKFTIKRCFPPLEWKFIERKIRRRLGVAFKKLFDQGKVPRVVDCGPLKSNTLRYTIGSN